MVHENFGDETLAHRVHGHNDVRVEDAITELVDNCIDAGATRIDIALALTETNVIFGVFDDGRGMKPGSDICANQSQMKGSGNIGKFYRGAFTAMLSLKATSTFMYSRQEGEPLYMMKYKTKQMLSDAKTKLNNETMSPQDLSREWISGMNDKKCICGPYQHGGCDDPINSRHIDDSIGPIVDTLTDDAASTLIRSFLDGTLEHGTGSAFMWPKEDMPEVSNSLIRQYLARLTHTRKIPEHVDITYRYKAECHHSPASLESGLFGDNITHDIHCAASPALGACFAQFMGTWYRLMNCADTISADDAIKAEDSFKFRIRTSIVSDSTHQMQMTNLKLCDKKMMNQPVIETPWGFLGIGGEYKIPGEYLGRSHFGMLEPIRVRVAITVDDKESEQTFFRVFGVNGKKDRPDNSKPCPVAASVYRFMAFWVSMESRKFGKWYKLGKGSEYMGEERVLDSYPFEIMKENGLTAETEKWCSKEDVAWILGQIDKGGKLSPPQKASKLRKSWTRDFMVTQHNDAVNQALIGVPVGSSGESESSSSDGESSSEESTHEAKQDELTQMVAVRRHIRLRNRYPTPNELGDISKAFDAKIKAISLLQNIIRRNKDDESFKPQTVGQYQLCLNTIGAAIGKLLEDPEMKQYVE